jgi:hypothetical protein
MRAVVLVEAPGAVGLTRVARNQCGGERDEARVPRLGNRQIPRLDVSIYRGCWSPLYVQVAEAVSISNRRLVLLLVRIRRILMKNTVGEISFVEADSQPETTTPIRVGRHWAS